MLFKAKTREVTGKKVKVYREKGLVPASIYGPKRKPLNLLIEASSFKKFLEKVGFSRFFDLEVDEKDKFKVLVKEVQEHPIKDKILSVSFYQVDESRKINVEVPIEFVGESPAVKQNLGFMIKQIEALPLYCLPKDLPNNVEVDISSLSNTGDSISVSEIVLPSEVELDSSLDPTSAVVYIAAAQKEEIVEEVHTEDEATESTEETSISGESQIKAEE